MRPMLKPSFVANTLLVVVMMYAVFLPQTALAMAKTGQVNLIATIGTAPALKGDVEWKIFRHGTSLKEMLSINKHSAVIDLPAGYYNIVASLEGKTRKKNLQVKAGKVHEVVLNLR